MPSVSGGNVTGREVAAQAHLKSIGAREDRMAEWIYFLHPPREDFAATMTEDEDRVWDEHFARLKRMLADGILVLAGPTLGHVNTGLVVFEAEDEAEARTIMDADPTIAGGYARGELREFRVSLLRGR